MDKANLIKSFESTTGITYEQDRSIIYCGDMMFVGFHFEKKD